jgi:hypothetical protein
MIAKKFPIKDLGPVTSILGLEIQCDWDLGELYMQQ